MQDLRTCLILILLGSASAISHRADGEVMREFGNYSPSPGVVVNLVPSGDDRVKVSAVFDPGNATVSGTLPVAGGRWAAQFRPPHELWFFDGRTTLILYERKLSPNGFKASSSQRLPEIWQQAPEALRIFVEAETGSESGYLEKPLAAPERVGTTAAFRELLLSYKWSWKNVVAKVPDRECVFMADGTFRHPNFVAKFAIKDIHAVHLTRKGGERAVLTFNADYTKFEAIDFQNHRITGERLGRAQ